MDEGRLEQPPNLSIGPPDEKAKGEAAASDFRCPSVDDGVAASNPTCT
jgi:hypothetical protein